jgi:photosystem II stability/assembly factor-like uncharacterized protein
MAAPSPASAQWVRTKGPEGGVVQSFVRAGSSVFATVFGAGVFRSDDDGASWKPMGGGFAPSEIRSLVSLGASLYACADSGVYRSRDLGATWVPSIAGIDEGYPPYAIHAMGSQLILDYGAGKHYRSADSGATWNAVPRDSLPYAIGPSLILGGKRLMGGDQLYVSENGGAWKGSSPGPASLPGTVIGFALGGATVFAGAGTQGIYLSRDSGATWSAANNGIAVKWTRSLYARGDTVLAGMQQAGIYRSVDGGATWTQPPQGPGNWNVWTLMASGPYILAGTDAGVYRSRDAGLTWEEASGGMLATQTSKLSAYGTTVYAATWGGQVHATRDLGESWTRSHSDSPDFPVFDIRPFGGAFYAASAAGLFRSPDSGATWNRIGTSLVDTYFHCLATIGPYLLAASYDGGRLYRTRDGVSWDTAGNRLDSVIANVLFVQEPYVYLGAGGKGVLRSRDSGNTWESFGRQKREEYVEDLAASGGLLFAAKNGAVWKTPLSDSQWAPAGGRLPHGNAQCLAVSGTRLFAGTDSGLYQSADSGRTWADAGQGLPAGDVRDLLVSGGYVYAGVGGAAVWRRSLSDLSNGVQARFSPSVPGDRIGILRGNVFRIELDGGRRAYDLRGVRFGTGAEHDPSARVPR